MPTADSFPPLPVPDRILPLVSVVIPVKDRRQWITGALESVFNQTYRPLEVVVVDNGSTDATPLTVTEWAAAHCCPGFKVSLVREKMPGASAARNCGTSISKGEFIVFLDSDDRMEPGLVAEAVARFESSPSAPFVAWRRRIVGGIHEGHINRLPGRRPEERQIVNCCLSTQSFMARRGAIEETGGWDPELPVWNDLEFGLRLLLDCGRGEEIDKVLCHTFWHADSLTGTGFGERRGQWEKSLDKMEAVVRAHSRPDLLTAVSYRRAVLDGAYRKEGLHVDRTGQSVPPQAGYSRLKRLVLKAVERYTALGLRGAWLWARHLLLLSVSGVLPI